MCAAQTRGNVTELITRTFAAYFGELLASSEAFVPSMCIDRLIIRGSSHPDAPSEPYAGDEVF